jgi:hypothetical protein
MVPLSLSRFMSLWVVVMSSMSVLQLIAGSSNDFAKFTTCAVCVDAGFGWSPTKQRCGGFANQECPAAMAGGDAVLLPNQRPAWVEDTVHILTTFCGSGYVTVEKMSPYFRSLLFHRSCKVPPSSINHKRLARRPTIRLEYSVPLFHKEFAFSI